MQFATKQPVMLPSYFAVQTGVVDPLIWTAAPNAKLINDEDGAVFVLVEITPPGKPSTAVMVLRSELRPMPPHWPACATCQCQK